ncbi:MAG: GTP cyclohydrolase II [Planctomycetales bacterium]|nr:GTP cyclohydrolase II [Planctomycetales bacterium]
MSQHQTAKQEVVSVCSARLPTIYAEFRMTVYKDVGGREHVYLSLGEAAGSPLLVRIHSECLTGDVFGSVRCDCREQLLFALETIAEEGRGSLVYLRQEGRGIGLTNKVHAYALQDGGLDTVDANLHLGLPVDDRSYSVAAAILRDQGVHRVRLLTNNPQKVSGLELGGIQVIERIPHEVTPRPENQDYLRTKADRLGHLLEILSPRVNP